MVLRQLQPIIIAVTPGLQMEMLSARMLAVGPGALAPFIDSTSTLTGRETQPLATIPLRKRWFLAAGGLVLAGAFALLWHRQQPADLSGLGHGPARLLSAARPVHPALPALLLPPRSSLGSLGSVAEPPPAGFTAPAAALATSSATSAPLPADSPAHRHHRRDRSPAAALAGAPTGHHHHRAHARAHALATKSQSPATLELDKGNY